MYVSGNQYDFELRLHQYPTSSGDIASFSTEFNSYSGDAELYLVNKWERELNKKREILKLNE